MSKFTIKNKSIDMLSGSISKALIAMTIPLIIMNILHALFNIVDLAVLRFFSDDIAVGAVGACSTLITLGTSLLTGVSIGANVIVAKRIGSGDRARTNRAFTTSVWLAVAGGAILMIIGMAFAETFLQWTNCPVVLLPQAAKYFRIYFCGMPIFMLYTFGVALLRATGDTQRPMYFMLLGGGIKIIFTLLFVAVFHFDTESVALSTIISNAVAGGLAFWVLAKAQHAIPIDFRHPKFDRAECKDILHVGITTGFHAAIFALANTVVTAAVNSLGEDATTGVAIAGHFDVILYHICYAPSLVVMSYVSQNVGAGNILRVKQTLVRSIWITIAMGVPTGLLGAFLSYRLASMISSSPAVIAFAQQRMIVNFTTYFICGIHDILGSTMRGLGKPNVPTLVTLLCVCPIRFIWVYFIFPLLPNIAFLHIVCPIEWTLACIALSIVYSATIAKMQKKERDLSTLL